MTTGTIAEIDKAAFFRFVEANSDGRYEFVRGKIEQQMAGGTRRHGRVADNFADMLKQQLDRAVWVILQARGVEMDETVRYPDVVVEPADDPEDALATVRPSLIIETLSPDSNRRDLREKPEEFLAIASLQAYIVASQDEALCHVWVRDGSGAFPAKATEVRGVGAIPALGLSIPLDIIYRGLL